MKKQYILIGVSLFISLFIYMFYRTEKTVVNEIGIWFLSISTYTSFKTAIFHSLPLNNLIVYSLPEGLWIFCITLTSKPCYLPLNNRRIDCVYIPLIFCCTLELMQLIHLTNGRFDFIDIGFFVLFWLFGFYGFNSPEEKRNVFTPLNSKTLVCVVSYVIIYLSHVSK
jgi:hypothetical protein